MRNLFLALGAILFSTAAFAQKGTFYIGGNVGYGSTTEKIGGTTVTEASNWSFSPEIGTFLTDNVQLGVGLTIMGSNIETSMSDRNQSVFGGTLYSRYFFGEGSKAFRPFVGVNLGLLPGSGKDTFNAPGLPPVETKFNSFEFNTNLNAGFAYALSPKVAVVGSLGVLGFSSEKIKPKDGGNETKTNSFAFDLNSLGNRFNIGLYMTL